MAAPISFLSLLRRVLVLPAALVVVAGGAALAQDAADTAAVERGFDVWKAGGCVGCHGWAGDGKRIGENPEAPSLRATELDDASIIEVVLCGRPGTAMPYHDPKAYTDDRCYGMTKADVEGVQLLEGKPVTAEEAVDLVAYMRAKMIGRPPEPNQDDCKAFYGEKPFCGRYPTAAEQGL
jgi:mono/diheme cytochrome c family protein